MASKGYDVQFGARPLKRALQNYVEDGICELIINEEMPAGSIVRIDKNPEKEELTFTHEAAAAEAPVEDDR